MTFLFEHFLNGLLVSDDPENSLDDGDENVLEGMDGIFTQVGHQYICYHRGDGFCLGTCRTWRPSRR